MNPQSVTLNEIGLPEACQLCDAIFRPGETRHILSSGTYCDHCKPQGVTA